MDLETWENTSMEEKHSKLLHDHLESYHAEPCKGINNEDIEKQCYVKTDVMQSVEYQSQLSYSHMDFPYDLELHGAYTMSYHLISLDECHQTYSQTGMYLRRLLLSMTGLG